MCGGGERPRRPRRTASILVSLCEAASRLPQRKRWVAGARSLWLQWAAPRCAFSRRARPLVCACVALWAACFMCDSWVTGMCSGRVTGETPVGNCKRLDHSLSRPVFFLSLLLASLTQPCVESPPLPYPSVLYSPALTWKSEAFYVFTACFI